MVLGAAVGAVSSFVIFLPPLNEMISLVIRLVTAAAVVFAAFFPTEKKLFVKAAAAYFLITFCFCGASIAFLMLLSPPIAIRNGAVYIDISPLMLVGIIFACYLVIRIICRVTGRSMPRREICKITIDNNGKSASLIAKADTGNTLREPFSGSPVVVAERDKLNDVLPREIEEYIIYTAQAQFAKASVLNETKKGSDILLEDTYMSCIRLIPYNSVGGNGLLPAFKPTSLKISVNGKIIEADAYIAVTERRLSETFSALIPLELISE